MKGWRLVGLAGLALMLSACSDTIKVDCATGRVEIEGGRELASTLAERAHSLLAQCPKQAPR